MLIPVHNRRLEGDLFLPSQSHALVIFAHGSGSSRHSPRNQYVARVLQEASIGTLLFDLLTPEEDQNYETRFDIALLNERLVAATEWLIAEYEDRNLSLGYFGASTGAAAALGAAAELGDRIHAVVSRGGRPDLAMEALPRVRAATLLIVGGLDGVVIDMNRRAFERLGGTKDLQIIPGATHLFEEPGKLEEVSMLATVWFRNYL